MNSIVTFLFTILVSSSLFGVTYTKSSAGNYTSAAGWTPSYPGTTIGSGDVVIINAAVTLNDDIKVEGTLTINAGASLTGNKEIEEIKSGGVLTVNGTLDIKKIDKIKGTANFNGTVEVDDDMKIEDFGNLTISSTGSFDAKKIEVKDNGILTVSGSLTISNELKMKDDAKVDFNNGSNSTIKDIEVEDDAELDAKAGSDLTVTNDLKVKDDAKLTVAGTITVYDDIELKDDSAVNITGVLNLCDALGNVDKNEFKVEQDVVFSGNGTFCMCSSNDDNDYDNESNNKGSITFNQNCNGPLPIELIDFNAAPISDNKVEIHWTTASEINNALFVLEFSLDGKHWEILSEIEGAGTSNEKINYSIFHETSNMHGSEVFYRLKNIDFDGKYDYSWIINLNLPNNTEVNSNQLSFVSVFPNPVEKNHSFHLKTNNNNQIQSIQLYSINGQSIEINWIPVNDEIIEIIPENLHSGLYKLIVTDKHSQLSTTIQIN